MGIDRAVYLERRVPRGEYALYAREYPGVGPAFVLMHGFPDNLRIYDSLAPLLATSGHRVVAFDFLGYGDSQKPAEFKYSLAALEDDLSAVVDHLKLDSFVPVAHDASGPTAINWALDHPKRIASLALLNTYFDTTATLRFPEFIRIFSDPEFSSLADAFQNGPVQFQWLLQFTQGRFFQSVSAETEERRKALVSIIVSQFAAKPSVFPAFRGLTRDLHAALPKNDKRVGELSLFRRPVGIIWGVDDPYLNRGVAEHMHEVFPGSTLTLLPFGHWPQIDGPEDVAKALLALPTQ